jgi:DNA-binding XRE family transcriptional regulator
MSTRIPPEFHRYRKAQDQPRAKLTNDQVVRIRVMYASDKYTQDFLAMCFGVAPQTIQKIVTGKKWVSVGGPITRRGSGPWKARNES